MRAILKPEAPVAPRSSEGLAGLAVLALVEEAKLTPKPGLVDLRGSGAHDDLNLDLMLRSAESLRETFAAIASTCEEARIDLNLRERLGEIGRVGEAVMLEVTGGANTHRGAIWTLGLLVAGASLSESSGAGDVAATASRIAWLPDARGTTDCTNGERVRAAYGVVGAREEARAGFPRLLGVALPVLRAGREAGHDEETVRLDALLAVMAVLDDTCLLHRGGLDGLQWVQRGARRVLDLGSASTPRGKREFVLLDSGMLERWLSPGGSADLLSAAMFLDSLERSV